MAEAGAEAGAEAEAGLAHLTMDQTRMELP